MSERETALNKLVITVWDIAGPRKSTPFGGTTTSLFNTDKTLKTGRQKLKLWLHREADCYSETTTPGIFTSTTEMDRLEKLVKRHEAGDIPRIDWLDNLVFRRIEALHAQAHLQTSSNAENIFFLYIDFPRFDFPIVYSEHEYPSLQHSLHLSTATGRLTSGGLIQNGERRILCSVWDPEGNPGRDNPVESKHRRLVRSHRNGPLDRDLKPNAKIRDELNEILNFSPTQELTPEEKDLLWKFRYYLTRDKRALTKFLKCVMWTDPTEVKQATELLSRWTEVDVDDALELLGPTFSNKAVRAYAVERLRKADDDELLLYLLQLVQALKFENITSSKSPDPTHDSSLAHFLITRSILNPLLGNNFYWYLMVEIEDRNSSSHKTFAKVSFKFMKTLSEMPDGLERRQVFEKQATLVEKLRGLSKEIQGLRDRGKKIERVRAFLTDKTNGMAEFDNMPFLLDASLKVVGLVPDNSTVFKSSLSPLLLHFKTTNPDRPFYPVIFKVGDDLRQDQLVIQIISLMDKLLLKENLDLKLTPYHILSTGIDHGIMEYIESVTLNGAIAKAGSILGYLKNNNPSPQTEYGVRKEVMETYVRSCAGYCVVTYILGVGDRHLDNLLLTPDGHFFHADFGFILGRDPKPFPPPQMKLSREMVEGMGGANSQYYQQFRSFCFTAYTTLRKSANLILNLFTLMVDANIPDIRAEPDKAVLKVKEKFCLEMSEEDAVKHFQNLIQESLGAFMPAVVDRMHNFMQIMRS